MDAVETGAQMVFTADKTLTYDASAVGRQCGVLGGGRLPRAEAGEGVAVGGRVLGCRSAEGGEVEGALFSLWNSSPVLASSAGRA